MLRNNLFAGCVGLAMLAGALPAVTDIGAYQAEWSPQRVYGRIAQTPTLGEFFEFDHSSAPSSPVHFQEALHSAGNGNFAIAFIPGANHGGYLVGNRGYRFDTAALTARSPLLIDTVVDWVERQVIDRARR